MNCACSSLRLFPPATNNPTTNDEPPTTNQQHQPLPSLIRILSLSIILASLVLVGYWVLSSTEQARTIRELRDLNAKMEQTLAQRQAMIERLSRSRRIAHLLVTDQQTAQDGSITSTSVDFIELNDRGAEIARQAITVPGDVLFVDAWTVKFDAALVADGDPMRGRSLVLLRRVYSDRLRPQDGVPLDVPGAIPPGYAASDAGRFEQQVWQNFWRLATDPKEAERLGVRVAQGEAVYKPVRAGQTYELIVDAVGGMSLKPLDATAMSKADQ